MKAYHIVGMTNLERGRQRAPELPARFAQIVASGALRPGQGMRIGEDTGRFFPLDRWAGDDHFVFLSVGPRYQMPNPALNYGFCFDVEALLQAGAILRAHDLLEDYGDLLDGLITDVEPFREPEDWTLAEQATLFAALADLDATDLTHPSPNDAYYTLRDAVEREDHRVPHVTAIIDAFRARVVELQAATQLTGAAAWAAAQRHGADGRHELLMPEQLPIAWATAYIVAGEEVSPG